ncbi:MAG: hypothetical protein ACLP1X_19110 [Polyangiaceae bacterium]
MRTGGSLFAALVAAVGLAVGCSKSASDTKCGATPTQFVDFSALATEVDASGGISAMPLAVDATNVYFVFDDVLMRVPIRGGSVVTMLSLSTIPDLYLHDVDLVVTSTSVILHYSGSTNELVVSVPIEGGSVTTLATSDGTIAAFGGNEHAVYFVDQGGLKSVPTTGGNVQVLTDQLTASDTGGFGALLVPRVSRAVSQLESERAGPGLIGTP